MCWSRTLCMRLALSVVLCLGAVGQARSQHDVVPVPDGIDVQARGPIHEAFAGPVQFAAPAAGVLVPKPPPEPIPELPSEMKPEGENVQWIPGYWSWDPDRDDFLWVSGFWRQPPPDRRWVPGYWAQAANGWHWVAGFWSASDEDEVQYLQSPPPPLETAPSIPQPNPNSTYVRGTWVYQTSRYMWRPGYWVTPQLGWVWVPAHYVWTPLGYVFVDGYWDYVPDNRGLLNAPVVFTRPLWRTPGWYYRPSFAVQLGGLLSALFVRPGTCSYYFGDYYGPSYANLGFQPWFQFGGRNYDPLYSYYRWHNRGNDRWAGDLQNIYQGRMAGSLPRPPRTLVQQQTLIQKNIVNNTTINNTNIVNNLRMVAPVTQVNNQNIRLTKVPSPQLTTYQEQARQLREVAAKRVQVEKAAPGPGKAEAPPSGLVAGKLKLPPAPEHRNQPFVPGRNVGRPDVTPSPAEKAAPGKPGRPQPPPTLEKPPPKPQPDAVTRPQPPREHKALPVPRPQPTPVKEKQAPVPEKKAAPAPKQQPQPENKALPVPRPQPAPVKEKQAPVPEKKAAPAPKPQPQPENKAAPAPRPQPQNKAVPAPKPQPQAEKKAAPKAKGQPDEKKPDPKPDKKDSNHSAEWQTS